MCARGRGNLRVIPHAVKDISTHHAPAPGREAQKERGKEEDKVRRRKGGGSKEMDRREVR